MSEHVDPVKIETTQKSPPQAMGSEAVSFEDNRPETVQLQQLQGITNQSAQVVYVTQLQLIANESESKVSQDEVNSNLTSNLISPNSSLKQVIPPSGNNGTVQRLLDENGHDVDIENLPDEKLLDLMHQIPASYTQEEGDWERVVAEYSRRAEEMSMSSENEEGEEEEEKEGPMFPEASYLGRTLMSESSSEEKKRAPIFPHSNALLRNSMDESSSADDEPFELSKNDLLINHMQTQGRYEAGIDKIKFDGDGEERELKEWGEKSLQGTVGEYMARNAMETMGDVPLNLNGVALNFSGIDNLTDNKDFPFEQTKMHIAPSTANTATYLNHLKHAQAYAIKGVRAIARHKNKLIAEILRTPNFQMPDKLRQVLEAVDRLDSLSDDDIWDSDAHKIMSASMIFSIPCDIYDQLDVSVQNRFIRLDYSVQQIRDLMEQMEDDFTPAKKGGKKLDPGTMAYNPEEEPPTDEY